MDFAESFLRSLGAAFNVCMYNLPKLSSPATPSHLVWRGRTVAEHQEQLEWLHASQQHFYPVEETEKDGKTIHWFKFRIPLLMDGRENPPRLWWLECLPVDSAKGDGVRGLVLCIPDQPRQILENIRRTDFTSGEMTIWGQPRSAEMIIAEHKAQKPAPHCLALPA